MKRCSLCEWIPILPWPVWPLAWQCSLGQNTVVGSMTILLAVRGNIATRSMSGPPFALQLHRTTVWCGATLLRYQPDIFQFLSHLLSPDLAKNFTGPSRRSQEHLLELIAKVRDRQMLLARAEAELAATLAIQPEPSTA